MSFSTESMIIARKGIFIQGMSFQISIQKSQSVGWGDDPSPLIDWFIDGGNFGEFVDKALMDLTSLCARSGHLVILLLGKPPKNGKS